MVPTRSGLRRLRGPAALLAVAALALSACGSESSSPSADPGASNTAECESKTPVRVVLQWVAQAQFAGYYQAKDKGFYDAACLDVTIQEGGVNVVPQQVLAAGNADFAVSLVTRTMVTREEGTDPVNIGQVFQRGGYLQVAWADSGIKTIEDLRGKRVGSWGYGNELALYSALRAAGIDPDKDVTIVQQPFDMSLLLKREVDAAQALTYNEYAQLLETTNPDTGELYQPSDFTVINLDDLGFTSLQDGIYARASWLKEAGNEDTAVRFLKASYQGWISCRDDFDSCVNSVLDNGSSLGEGHQRWMLNEVNKLIWPSPNGIGVMDKEQWDNTIEVAIAGNVLKQKPDSGAYRTDLTEKANAELTAEGLDVKGLSFEPLEVTVTPNGE